MKKGRSKSVYELEWKECALCHGTGRWVHPAGIKAQQRCSMCGGKGRVEVAVRVKGEKYEQ